jgi:hypothetical protein
MADPTLALTTAIENATKVANTPLFTTVIDKVTGFKISQWAAEGEVRKKQIHDEYEDSKKMGIVGIQYVSALRSSTNLINTAIKSSQYIEPNKTNEIEMDNDFFWNTVEHSKNVSNEEMQDLIAKIIAGEYNFPGTYSMSTLQTIKMLDKNEIELFERVCCLLINEDQIPQELFSLPEDAKDLMKNINIDFESLQTLQSLGLFLPNDMTRSIQNPEKKNFKLVYFDKNILFVPENENYLKIEMQNFYGLSKVGKQILKHVKPKYNEKYFIWLKENYKIPNYKLKEE